MLPFQALQSKVRSSLEQKLKGFIDECVTQIDKGNIATKGDHTKYVHINKIFVSFLFIISLYFTFILGEGF